MLRVASRGMLSDASIRVSVAVLSMVRLPSKTNCPVVKRASTPAGMIQSPLPGITAICKSPPGGAIVALEPIPLEESSAATREPDESKGRVARPEPSVVSKKPCEVTLAPAMDWPTKSVTVMVDSENDFSILTARSGVPVEPHNSVPSPNPSWTPEEVYEGIFRMVA